MTREEIEQAWNQANAIYGFDPIADDAEAKTLLHNPPGEHEFILENIAGIKRIQAEHPNFFEIHDYDWAFDSNCYRRALEANLQTRALQILAAAYCSPNGPRDAEFSNVVLRYTFEASADPCTPFHAPINGINFIVSPFSFHEFTLLMFRAFLDSVGASRSWDGFLHWKSFSEDPSPFLRQALLRALTSDAFHSSFTGESPVDQVKRQSSWFLQAKEAGDIDETVEVPLTFSMTDFALAHELGHVLHRHHGVAREPDLRLERERDADAMGFALYNLSWGWRDDVLDGAPLNQGPRILLGPLMFHLFIRWHVALRQGLMLARLRSGETLRADTLRGEVADAESRAKTTFAQLGAYEGMIRQRGALFTDQDSALIQMIAASGSAFALAIVRSASSIPEVDLRIALDVGNIGF